MNDPYSLNPERVQKLTLAVCAVLITGLFLWMIQSFLITLLFAAILSAMANPLHSRLIRFFKGRKALASVATLLFLLLLVIIPATAFLVLVATQAVDVAQRAQPWFQQQIQHAPEIGDRFRGTALYEALEPHRDTILQKAGEGLQALGQALVGVVTRALADTVSFLFQLFVMLYAAFFFLIDGRSVLRKILYYLPLAAHDENQMIERFVSVTRATIKGTLVVGIVQGALGGIAFWFAGIEGAALWAATMIVSSLIPAIGPSLVWVPAVLYLYVIRGDTGKAIALGIYCLVVVSTVDNVLRPRLVGQDTKMPDLLILLSTLGGLVLFGATGIVIGPIIGALFVTVWDLYGAAFRSWLPPVRLSTIPPPEVGPRTREEIERAVADATPEPDEAPSPSRAADTTR